jgi:ribosome biogenesis GTPase A
LNPEIDMLDTPGILWPKFDDQETALNLAFTGAIKDDIMDVTEIAAALAERLSSSYPQLFLNRFRLEQTSGMTGLQLVEAAGKEGAAYFPAASSICKGYR